MKVLFYVVAVLVIVVFWMKVVEMLGWSLSSIFFFIEEKIEKLEKEFSLPEDTEKKDCPQQAGDLCPYCKNGELRIEYSPLHPQMTGDAYAPLEFWPYNLLCSFCGVVIPGKY